MSDETRPAVDEIADHVRSAVSEHKLPAADAADGRRPRHWYKSLPAADRARMDAEEERGWTLLSRITDPATYSRVSDELLRQYQKLAFKIMDEHEAGASHPADASGDVANAVAQVRRGAR